MSLLHIFKKSRIIHIVKIGRKEILWMNTVYNSQKLVANRFGLEVLGLIRPGLGVDLILRFIFG